MSTSLEPAQDLRSGINAVTFFAFTMFCIRIWFSIDPQPEPMTLAVQQASEERMSAYFVVAGVMLRTVRFTALHPRSRPERVGSPDRRPGCVALRRFHGHYRMRAR
jgi:hypothetical protein